MRPCAGCAALANLDASPRALFCVTEPSNDPPAAGADCTQGAALPVLTHLCCTRLRCSRGVCCLAQVLFAVFCILAIVGRATGQHTMWKAAFPAPTVVAMVLICAIWCSPGVRCPKYGTGVLLGLLLTLGGDIFIVEPPDLELFFLAFLFSMAGMFSFTFAFWAPSVPTSRLADANVDTSRSASTLRRLVIHRWCTIVIRPPTYLLLPAAAAVCFCAVSGPASAAGVPLNMFRLVPVLALAGAVVAAWRTVGWRHTPLVVPVGIYLGTVGYVWRCAGVVVCACAFLCGLTRCTLGARGGWGCRSLMLWRAAARIGYRVPVPSPKVSAMLKRSMSKRMQEWEHVEVQWAGLLGAFCLALGQLLVGYNRLWVADRYEVIEYASASTPLTPPITLPLRPPPIASPVPCPFLSLALARRVLHHLIRADCGPAVAVTGRCGGRPPRLCHTLLDVC